MNDSPKKLWIVTEGLAGTENQCLGVAEALQAHWPDLAVIPFRTALRQPWKSLSPWLGFEQWWSFEPMFIPPWPDIVITAGRKAIAASRFIKSESGGQTFTLHLQDPHIHPKAFDLVAVPAHDKLRGDNVIVTAATPNRITRDRLDEAAESFPALTALPAPRAAVLIGGNSKTHRINSTIAKTLISQLEEAGKTNSLMITTSRRTPESLRMALQKHFGDGKHFLWDGKGSNPYFAMLALADTIIATNDSASMLSEAATTGKPVYSVKLEGGSPKFDRLYTGLQKIGALREFSGAIEHWNYTKLNDSNKVADAVIKELSSRPERSEVEGSS